MTFINKDNYLSWLLLLMVAVVVGLFCYINVWLGDDINYAFSCVTERRDELIHSISDIFISQNAHYFTTNGRYVPHVFVQLFCGILGHGAFAIANGVFYVFFFLLLGKLCGVKKSDTRGFLTLLLVGLLTFQTKMVPSCQIGYIWTFTFTMLFLDVFFNKGNRKNAIWLIAAFGGSLLAGNGQEALNLGVSGALLVYWMGNMRKMSSAQYAMMIGFGLGTIICCLSPGARGRAAELHFSLIDYIYKCSYFFLDVRAFYFLVIIVLWQKYINGLSLKSIYESNMFYWHIWLFLFLFKAASGCGSNRQLMGMELVSIIMGMRQMKSMVLPQWVISILGVITISLYAMQWGVCWRINRLYADIESQYKDSMDGCVYVDLDQHNHLPHSTLFNETIPYYRQRLKYHRYSESMYEDDCLGRLFCKLYPGKCSIRVLPSYLKGKRHVDMGNRIVEVQAGILLVIQDKHNPQTLYHLKNVNFCGFSKHYEPMVVDIPKNRIIFEGDKWQASLIDKGDYISYGISKEEFCFR